ncbi:MAG TPA: RidA family protein [Acidimicrobiales bacterium]|nr:RidA family protein [Acidimicrobiales bacterium]
MTKVQRARSGSPFEERFGFCRAVRIDDRVFVAGTAPIWPDGSVDPDPAAQMRRCLEIVGSALDDVGASLQDVVRTRMYLVGLDDAAAVGAVHGEVFAAKPPAATMVVVAALLDARWRVELEVDAVSTATASADV